MLALKNVIITIDTMGYHKKITEAIIEAEADFVIQVKGNQKNMREDIVLYFQDSTKGPFEFHEIIDGDYGRIETRLYFSTFVIDWLRGET